MSRRSRAAYFAQLDRPISWCWGVGCRNRGARFSTKDQKYLCKTCRAAERVKKGT